MRREQDAMEMTSSGASSPSENISVCNADLMACKAPPSSEVDAHCNSFDLLEATYDSSQDGQDSSDKGVLINERVAGANSCAEDQCGVSEQVSTAETVIDGGVSAGSCFAFGTTEDDLGYDDSHNLEVIRLIAALGHSGSGRKAVIKAIAGRQGIVDEKTA